jgi:transcriptional regulator with XRE-family HTH domain
MGTDAETNKMIGTIIRRRRIELGLSQEELAERCGFKSKSSINKMESGVQGLPQSKIIAVAKALETTPGYILGWEGVEENQQQEYYTDEATAQIAEDMATNPNLRMLYDVQRDMDPEDLQAMYSMAMALKRKAERLDSDDPA